MIYLKSGIKLLGIQPEILLALQIIEPYFEERRVPLVITEATGGKHKIESLHYHGLALDIRSKDLGPDAKAQICMDVLRHLQGQFDFLLEGAGTENEHFHLEFDPKN